MILDFGFWILDCRRGSESQANRGSHAPMKSAFPCPADTSTDLPSIQNPKSKIQNNARVESLSSKLTIKTEHSLDVL
jgi:hypothetical protein